MKRETTTTDDKTLLILRDDSSSLCYSSSNNVAENSTHEKDESDHNDRPLHNLDQAVCGIFDPLHIVQLMKVLIQVQVLVQV